MFVGTFGGILLPAALFPRDPQKQTGLRSARVLSLCNCVSAGIFLAVCFLGLIPYVEHKFATIWDGIGFTPPYPVAHLCIISGFFLILLIEGTVRAWREHSLDKDDIEAMLKQPREFIYYDSDSISDESDLPLEDEADTGPDCPPPAESLEANRLRTLGGCNPGDHMAVADHGGDEATDRLLPPSRSSSVPSRRKRSSSRRSRRRRVMSRLSVASTAASEANDQAQAHAHSHLAFLSETSSLRCGILLVALSVHSLFEGLALGLQEAPGKLVSLYVGVIAHEVPVALALGVALSKREMALWSVIKLATLLSFMIPIGMAVGIGIAHTQQSAAGGVVSAVIQGLAAGTFLYVVFLDLLPDQLNSIGDRLLKVLAIFGGFVVIACMRLAVTGGEGAQ